MRPDPLRLRCVLNRSGLAVFGEKYLTLDLHFQSFDVIGSRKLPPSSPVEGNIDRYVLHAARRCGGGDLRGSVDEVDDSEHLSVCPLLAHAQVSAAGLRAAALRRRPLVSFRAVRRLVLSV